MGGRRKKSQTSEEEPSDHSEEEEEDLENESQQSQSASVHSYDEDGSEFIGGSEEEQDDEGDDQNSDSQYSDERQGSQYEESGNESSEHESDDDDNDDEEEDEEEEGTSSSRYYEQQEGMSSLRSGISDSSGMSSLKPIKKNQNGGKDDTQIMANDKRVDKGEEKNKKGKLLQQRDEQPFGKIFEQIHKKRHQVQLHVVEVTSTEQLENIPMVPLLSKFERMQIENYYKTTKMNQNKVINIDNFTLWRKQIVSHQRMFDMRVSDIEIQKSFIYKIPIKYFLNVDEIKNDCAQWLQDLIANQEGTF